MDLNEKILMQLIELMQRDGLDRLALHIDDVDLDLRMSAPPNRALFDASAASMAAAVPSDSKTVARPDEAPANVRKVLAPLVGVFYRAPAPGAAPFVEVGDAVSEGQVLCILEAMKLMNEIVSEHAGKVSRVCVKDGDLVSLHQELFWIET